MPRSVRVAGLLGAALVVLLTACDPEEIANRIAEDAAERATGQDVEIDPETGEVTIEGENVGTTIPTDFPIAAVPLPDAGLVAANSSPEAGGTEWNVLYEVGGPEALAAYRAQVEAAGYLIANELPTPASRASRARASPTPSLPRGSTGTTPTTCRSRWGRRDSPAK